MQRWGAGGGPHGEGTVLGRSQVTDNHSLKVLYEARLVEPRSDGGLDLVSGRSRSGQEPLQRLGGGRALAAAAKTKKQALS